MTLPDSLEVDSYQLLDIETGNAVAFFHSRAEVEAAVPELIASRPVMFQNEYALVSFDKSGIALESWALSDLAQS